MKVGVNDIRNIKVGETKIFSGNPRELNSARAISTYAKYTYPEDKKGYKTKVNYIKEQIAITAIAINQQNI